MDLPTLLKYWKEASLSGLLAGVLGTGYLGYWVFGSTYQDALKERDSWKELYVQAVNGRTSGPRPVGMAPPVVASPDDSLAEARSKVRAMSPASPK